MTDEMEALKENEDVRQQEPSQEAKAPVAKPDETPNESFEEFDPLPLNLDISKQFFELCEGLERGELVTAKVFHMAEVMSAIELMEPKMDVGVNSRYIKNLEAAISEGLYADDYPLQLAIMDATLAMMVAWLDGCSLGSTVWSNVMLASVKHIRHPVFHPFAAGVNLLVRNIHSLVNNVGNLEELPEDFNPQILFGGTIWAPRGEIVLMMRDQIAVLAQIGKSWKICPRAETLCRAIATRLEIVLLLLEILGYLVPPEIEDPNYGNTFHMGDGEVRHETEYGGIIEEDGTVITENIQSLAEGCTEEERQKNEDTAKKIVEKLVEDFVGKNVREGVAKASASEKPKVAPKVEPEEEPKDEPQEEPEKKKEEEKEQPPSADDSFDEDLDDRQFKPNFQFAGVLAARLIKVTDFNMSTVKYGRRGPDGVDGDYGWLMPFEPKACVRMTPACFPRQVKIPTREAAAEWWRDCAIRIENLITVCPKSVKDLNMMFYFARNFNLNACVFTRSLLQVCMFPIDSHLCGDETMTVADPIENSLKGRFLPQVLDEESPVHHDELARQYYSTFLNHMTKLAITVYSSFGCNLSRQRDRLEMALEDLAQIQYHAGLLENRTDVVMMESGTIAAVEDNYSYQSTVTFVFHNLLATTSHYFELGFRMDLYVPYEFTYMYWYLGSLQARWMMTTLNRSRDIQMSFWNSTTLSTTRDPARIHLKNRLQEELQTRLESHQFNVMNQYGMMRMSEGIVKLTVVLIRLGVLRVPDGGDHAERLRFERRFEPFQNLGSPLSVNYEKFKEDSGVDAMYEEDLTNLIGRAAENFKSAFGQLQCLDNRTEQNQESMLVEDAVWSHKTNYCSVLIKVAKANLIACNLLKMNVDLTSRIVEWKQDPDFPLYPSLQIKNK